jgi:hypothetical protein
MPNKVNANWQTKTVPPATAAIKNMRSSIVQVSIARKQRRHCSGPGGSSLAGAFESHAEIRRKP